MTFITSFDPFSWPCDDSPKVIPPLHLSPGHPYPVSCQLDDRWPESKQERSHRCMYDFHQKREGDRDEVCRDVEWGREMEREREKRCEDVKMYDGKM